MKVEIYLRVRVEPTSDYLQVTDDRTHQVWLSQQVVDGVRDQLGELVISGLPPGLKATPETVGPHHEVAILDELRAILKTPEGKSVIDHAQDLMSRKGAPRGLL